MSGMVSRSDASSPPLTSSWMSLLAIRLFRAWTRGPGDRLAELLDERGEEGLDAGIQGVAPRQGDGPGSGPPSGPERPGRLRAGAHLERVDHPLGERRDRCPVHGGLERRQPRR